MIGLIAMNQDQIWLVLLFQLFSRLSIKFDL